MFDHQASIASLVFCRWDVIYDLPKPRSIIVWDKGSHSAGDLQHEYGRRWECVAFYPGPDHKFHFRPVDMMFVPRVPANQLVHPAEKPIGVFERLIMPHPGDVIDPFMGTGASLMAAKRLGRNAVGIEVNERWCEVAATRLSQEVLPLDHVGSR